MKARTETCLTGALGILVCLFVIAMVVAINAGVAWALMWSWNTVAVELAKAPPITIWHSIAVMVLICTLKFLFHRGK